MVVGGESGMFLERIEKMCVCWCVCVVCVCVCKQDTPSGRKEENFRLRLQGKAPMWPKLPKKACTAAQLCSKQEGKGSRSGQQTRGASPKSQYVIAGFSVGKAARTPKASKATYQIQILTREQGHARIPKSQPASQSDSLTA